MGLGIGIWMCVLGVLGAASLIIAKKPEAKGLIDKLTPFQGWIGAISALWGVWVVVYSILNLGWIGQVPVWWGTVLAQGVVLLLLGLLLGVGVLKTFIKAEQAQAKMDTVIARVAPWQGTLGLVGIGLGIWGVLATFVLTVG